MKNFKSAFTLAEVLIVIGVIGVVAALTIPTLIKNQQKKTWVEQLRTSVVKIQDGFRLAMAEDGVDDLGETELWRTISVDGVSPYNIKTDGKPFIDRLSQYLKISLVQDNNEYSFSMKQLKASYQPTFYGAIQLLNGAMITSFSFYSTDYATDPRNNYGAERAQKNGGAMWTRYGSIYIDVNGPTKPNQMGRDIFSFYIAQNGLLYPAAGKDALILAGATFENYKTNSSYWAKSRQCDPTNNSAAGEACAARIIEEGWKMNY